MKKKVRSRRSDMPIGTLRRVKDMLPPPEELVVPDATVKVTIALNKSSIDFFKKAAKKNQTKYQKMIRSVLDHYVQTYSR